MKKKQFKAESKKLLDMMIHSIYTNQEIFLRELISNASDALDKLYYRSLTDKKLKVKKKELEIRIIPDKENRTLTIQDNGIGMTEEELEELSDAEAQFQGLLEEGDLTKLAEADVEFHEIIYRAAENKRLLQVLNNLREQIYRYRVEYLKDEKTRQRLVKEHQEMLEAIRDREDRKSVV